AQAFGTGAHDEGLRSELLREIDAVIAGIGLAERRKFVCRLPVETAAIDQGAADGYAVAAQPFCGGMHDDVAAMLDGTAKIGRPEGGVDHKRQPRLVSDRSHARN